MCEHLRIFIYSKAWLTHMLKGELEENLWLQDVIYQELVEESYQW